MLLIRLLIAHILADFYFQPEKWCEKKKEGKIKYHLYHTLIVFVCSWILSLSLEFWWLAGLLAISHWGTDYLKYKLAKKSNSIWWFTGDQFIHIIAIIATWIVWYYFNPTYISYLHIPHITTILAILICLKPANLFIKKFFLSENLSSTPKEEGENLPKAGRIIGSLERILTLILIIIGQWGAVGFLLGAKSILRFGEKERPNTEYLLIGSLLSFGIAIVLGILCIYAQNYN